MAGLWKKLKRDPLGEWPTHLEDTDVCCFAHDYVSHGGFAAGEGNNLISNFKKPISEKGKPSWNYKLQAINRFARELSSLDLDNYHITCMPSSKTPDHPEYDNRLEQTLHILHRIKPTIYRASPFANTRSRQALHLGEGTRNPVTIYNNLTWQGLPHPMGQLIVIDDVLTTGCNFKACQRLLSEKAPGTQLIGIFWAKTTWPQDY